MEYGGEILMLTWQSSLGLAFDAETLEPTREFTTPMPDGEPPFASALRMFGIGSG